MGYIRCCSKRRKREINIGSKLITFCMIKTHFDWLKIHHISIDIRKNLAKHNSLRRTDCRRQIFVLGFTLVWAFEGLSLFFLQFAHICLQFVTNIWSVEVFFLTDMQMQSSRTQMFILRHTSEVSHVQRDGRTESPHNDVLHSILSFHFEIYSTYVNDLFLQVYLINYRTRINGILIMLLGYYIKSFHLCLKIVCHLMRNVERQVLVSFLFRHSRKISKSDNQLRHVYLSVRME